ncbi:MAG: beta-galactosidase [Akkermansia sp.]|nr:beta-galactosidase [Akkermansia sp.]
MGGLPTYLIRDDVTPLSYTGNAQFLEAQTRYLEKMAEIAIPRLSRNGGPILMVQLENEYGSYKTAHDEMAYIEWLKNFWSRHIGPQERLYCPGEFLKQGVNVVEIVDLHMVTDTPPAISGKTERNMEVRKYTESLNNQWD